MQVKGSINVSRELAELEVAERIERSIRSILAELNVPINIRSEYVQSDSVGGEVVLWGRCDTSENPIVLGASALIERGKKSEEIAKSVSEDLLKKINSGNAVDHYSADQLIPFMGLLPGSVIEASSVSDHTRTNIYVVEKFLNVGFIVNNNMISVQK